MHKKTVQRVQIALALAMINIYALTWAAIKDPLVGYSAVALIAISTITVATRRRWIPRLSTLAVSHTPTKHRTKLWFRDHWKRFLVVIPLGLAGFLAWYFWPWGLGLASIVLFFTTTSATSWRRVRRGQGGMEFPHQTVLRTEGHHPLAFFVFGWEWGKPTEWGTPERGEEPWIQWALQTACALFWRIVSVRRSWPAVFTVAVAITAHTHGLKTLVGPQIVVWLTGLVVATNHWWRFAILVWPAYRVVLTDETVVVVYPVRGVLGTIDITAPEIPLTKICHWQTTRRALGGGDWDPAFVFGQEDVVLRWLRDPEGFKQAAREQLERVQAKRYQR